MWKSKKFIVSIVIAVVALVGGLIGGFAYAADDSGSVTVTPQTKQEQLMNRVAEIYQQNTGATLNLEQLQKAMVQAQKEQQVAALQEQLQKMVTAGTITQEQADAYLAWWQAKPDVPGLMGGMGVGPMGGNRQGFGPKGGMMRGSCNFD